MVIDADDIIRDRVRERLRLEKDGGRASLEKLAARLYYLSGRAVTLEEARRVIETEFPLTNAERFALCCVMES